MDHLDWATAVVQGIFTAVLSGVVSGVVVAYIKAKLEHEYTEKRSKDDRGENLRAQVASADKKELKTEITGLKNEVSFSKVKLGKVEERLAMIKAKIDVIESRQSNQTEKIDDLKESLKGIQNYGKVRHAP